MATQPRLELTWIGKDVRPRLEPRILLEDGTKSYHATARRSEADIFDNMLIHGDNLLALKALEQKFTGKVKCIYIDPPYNTGSAFEHYDDGVEHSLWLSLMRDRLEIMKNLLAEDGSLWVSLDDNEQAYFKVMCDEVFGRKDFVATVIWRKNYSPKSSARHFSEDHDYILVYAKNSVNWHPNPMPRTLQQNKAYKNPDNDPRGPWRPNNLSARNYYSKGTYSITCPSGRIIDGPPLGSFWRISKEKLAEMDADNRIWWGKDGNNVPAPKIFLSEVKDGRVPQTFWPYEEVGHTQEAKKEIVALFGNDVFDTPKPERLIQRILQIATNPGDLVLDSFLGSGTTAAVAHKMGRRWIGIELGEQCYTHCLPRLQKVIDGTDEGGITYTQKEKPVVSLCKACKEALCADCAEKVGHSDKPQKVWFGGGGFRFYELAPSLIKTDSWGNQIINPRYNAEMLAEALCKLEGFNYAPSAETFWQQGHSTEQDFIYVTTQTLTLPMLEALNEAVDAKGSLLICCGACAVRQADLDNLERLTVKKIPQAVLRKCEWDHDDYSLSVSRLPEAEPATGADPAPEAPKPASRRRGRPRGQLEQNLLLPLPGKGE